MGVGNTLLGVIGLGVFVSLNSGLISRSAQAFGTKDTQLIGFYLHRALIINMIMLIPAYCIMYWSDVIFSILGFEGQFAIYLQQFLSSCIPGLFSLMILNTLSSYLYSCDIFLPSAVVMIVSSAVFSVISYILLAKTDMDIGAIAISYNGMHTLAAMMLFLYIRIKDPVPGSFFWFKAQSFKEIWTLFKHEVFVGSMIFFEWIASEIIYLFSGRLNITEITALTIVYSNSQMLYAVPVSLAESVLVFVGNSMGEGNIEKAKNFIKSGLLLSLVALIGVEIFYIVLNRQVAEFYTFDINAIKKTVEIFRIYLFYFPIGFLKSILSSGLQAIGKEKLGFVIFFVCFYLIAIPASYLLCFCANLQAIGLIYGGMLGSYCLFGWLVFSYSRIDWEKQKNIIIERIENDHNVLKELSNKINDRNKDNNVNEEVLL